MGLFTLYNVVSPIPTARFPQQLSDLLEPLGLTATESYERDDGSLLVLLEHEEPTMHLGVWIVPLEEGQFTIADFDTMGDEGFADAVRTVCKVGAQEGGNPALVTLTSLAIAAGLADEGRVYDLHANLAFAQERASELSSSSEPFNIRNFVSYHYLAPPSGESEHSWLHLHGMAKFFGPDFEAFDIPPDVSHKALAMLMHLGAEVARGEASVVNQPRAYGHGAFMLRPGDEVRPSLEHFSEEHFDAEHAGPTLVVEDAGAFKSLDKLLRGAYELEPKTRNECEAEQRVWQRRLESIRTARHDKKRQMILRAALEVGDTAVVEHIWVEIKSWEGQTIEGALLNDAFGDTTMTRGTVVSFAETTISGVSFRTDDQVLDEVETLRIIDRGAADLLDRALASPKSARQTGESASPDDSVIVRFEDDGQVGALHVLADKGTRALCDPIWLYNRRPTPPILDLRRLTQLGRPPLMSEVYTSQLSPVDAPILPRVSFDWDSAVVRVTLNGELWAIVDTAQGKGWSRKIMLPCRFGRPLDEQLDDPTIRSSSTADDQST